MAYNSSKEKYKKVFINNKESYYKFIAPYKTYINFVDFSKGDKEYYGFRNKNNLDILPKYNKVLFDDEYNIVALDFVIFAYKQMTEKYYSLLQNSQASKNSTINNILSKPEISQVGLNFKPQLDKNSLEFNNKVNTNLELKKATTDIKEYISSYISNVANLKLPIQTHLKYLNFSRLRNINGLTITLKKYDFNNDQQKVDFISDLNFPILRKLSEQYGFYIDENAPWQLTANLSHPNIISLISKLYPDVDKQQITPDFIIDKYYDILLFLDYEEQKKFFYDSYVKLYEKSPEFSQPFYCDSKEKTKLDEIARQEPPNTFEDFLQNNEIFFLVNYLKILNSENRFKYNSVEINQLINDVKAIYSKAFDKNKALLYIYGKFETLVP